QFGGAVFGLLLECGDEEVLVRNGICFPETNLDDWKFRLVRRFFPELSPIGKLPSKFLLSGCPFYEDQRTVFGRVGFGPGWKTTRGVYREELFEMLGLKPLPEKTDLKPIITGKVEREDFTVENLQLQTLPGLYIAANLYLPKDAAKPAPAILYVSGHGPVITN